MIIGLLMRASGSYPLSAPPWIAGSHTSGSPSINASARLCNARALMWSPARPQGMTASATIASKCSRGRPSACAARMLASRTGKTPAMMLSLEQALITEVQRRVLAQRGHDEVRPSRGDVVSDHPTERMTDKHDRFSDHLFDERDHVVRVERNRVRTRRMVTTTMTAKIKTEHIGSIAEVNDDLVIAGGYSGETVQHQHRSCTRRTVTRPLKTNVPMVETHDASDSCSPKCYALWCPSSQELFAVATGRGADIT